ncbi:GNAT family N-acetyltransferase [Kallotenue papyrolyticum]|uniref:GNAT family N-acetyltransferase n=1 Tax=Kallotenue papyrolyticum TaxID=1325125 RepID=UPI001377E1CC|nr:GNAT family N-acetyltransferase [Kallotenue papyrolyticum]
MVTPLRSDRQLLVRPARANDFEAVALLFGELHAFNAQLDPRFALADDWRAVLQAHFQRTWNDPGALWLLAWSGATPVGLLIMQAHQDARLFRCRQWAELAALYVAPGWRGQGLAQRLLAEARAWAARHGFDRIQLYVTAANTRARRFYRQTGFRLVQEIWRLEVAAAEVAPPDDPVCDATQALSTTSHRLDHGEDQPPCVPWC